MDLRKPYLWYPVARAIQRRFIYHAGPTNSGKTFTALEVRHTEEQAPQLLGSSQLVMTHHRRFQIVSVEPTENVRKKPLLLEVLRWDERFWHTSSLSRPRGEGSLLGALRLVDAFSHHRQCPVQAMKQASSGLYCGPLRLLAMEVYDELNAGGTFCNLITGDAASVAHSLDPLLQGSQQHLRSAVSQQKLLRSCKDGPGAALRSGAEDSAGRRTHSLHHRDDEHAEEGGCGGH